MRLELIVNASASSVTARGRVVIQKALAADHEVTVVETSRRGHATRLAQDAAGRGLDVVVVLGGDGTLNEAANGLVGSRTALAVLPGGSTNVLARTIGVTNDPIEATGQLLGALASGAIREVSVGQVNGRYFLFHVGLGFDAAVVAQVERRATLKRYLGPALFVGSALTTWARGYDRRHPHLAMEIHRCDGTTRRVDDGYFAVCLNTNPYTFFGERPIDLAPGTSFDTPLTVVVLRSLALWRLLLAAGDALRGGERLAGRRGVEVVTGVERAVVVPREPLPYQVDGDYLGLAERLELRLRRDCLRLVGP